MSKNPKTDFVILWVDGNDKEWQKEKEKYSPIFNNGDNNGENRYRDWDNLQYWFRGVEKNANWVNKIFFITWGHIPSWLNINNPKLRIVKHEEFIPKEYLPTYNSNTIELNLFRIKDLSENFVLFNDDQFIIRSVKEEEYFRNNLPVEYYSECLNTSIKAYDTYSHNLLNNMSIINKKYSKKKVYRKNIFKYLNIKYGLKGNISTLLLSAFNQFSLIENQHLPAPLKKSTLKKLWNEEEEIFNYSCLNRFRDLTDITQFLIRYDQLCSGNFYPKSFKYGKSYALQNNINQIIKDIKRKKYKVVCLNDTENEKNFDYSKSKIINMFDEIYPEKSSFEK